MGSSVNAIFNSFGLSNNEYLELESEFGKLCYKIGWELKRKNSKNNYVEDLDDVMQELRFSMVKAGCYYKRQTYLKECMQACRDNIKDKFLLKILDNLQELWDNRTHHGAHRQCFGKHQEMILEMLTQTLSKENRPQKRDLKIDKDFSTYCKSIAWNCEKNMGKKITRERSIRNGMTSLSEFDFLANI